MTRAHHHTRFAGLVTLAAALAVALTAITMRANVGGAGFTTFVDAAQCKDSPNGINCNNYVSKDGVYTNGGPASAALTNGCYYFSVLAPGSQNGGFIDGSDGNLSDTTPGNGGPGGGDDYTARVFEMTSAGLQYPATDAAHNCVTSGTLHATGTGNNGTIVQLSPYDNTPNPGGVYIMALCQVGATSSSQCKFDAFRAPAAGVVQTGDQITACKYYDGNADGTFDVPDAFLSGWPMTLTLPDATTSTQSTDATGCTTWSDLQDGTYTVAEGAPHQTNWLNSDPGPNPTPLVSPTGPSQTVVVSAADPSASVVFGNYCTLTPGGLTMGYWSNTNGQALITAGDLSNLSALNLRDLNQISSQARNDCNFDPTAKNGTGKNGPNVNTCGTSGGQTFFYRPWLIYASASNMAYMLSAQLSALKLNLNHGVTSNITGTFGSFSGSVTDLVAYANYLLGKPIASTPATAFSGQNGGLTVLSSPLRTEQDRIQQIVNKINNGGSFVQPTAASCAAPTF